MGVRPFLEFIADARGVPRAQRYACVDKATTAQSREGAATAIETLSKGFKRRVGLAQAILHDPKVLILDEPTDGLDPNQKHEVRTLINAMARDKTIIVSTHVLEEVHAVCSRAIIIAGGRVLADATPAELEARSRYYQAVSLTADDAKAAKEALSRVADVASIEVDAQDGRITAFPKPGRRIFAAINEALNEPPSWCAKWPLKAVASMRSFAPSPRAAIHGRRRHESISTVSNANYKVTSPPGGLRVHRIFLILSSAFTFYWRLLRAGQADLLRSSIPAVAVSVPGAAVDAALARKTKAAPSSCC